MKIQADWRYPASKDLPDVAFGTEETAAFMAVDVPPSGNVRHRPSLPSAVELAARSFHNFLGLTRRQRNINPAQHAILDANKAVWILNQSTIGDGPIYGCEAGYVSLDDGRLTWCAAGGCFFAICDSSGKLKFVSDEDLAGWLEHLAHPGLFDQTLHWKRPTDAAVDLDKLPIMNPITGHTKVGAISRCGEYQPEPGDRIVLGSSVLLGCADSPKFWRTLADGSDSFLVAWGNYLTGCEAAYKDDPIPIKPAIQVLQLVA